jgi:alanine racemase
MMLHISHFPDGARTWAEIDLDAVRHNTRVLLSLLKRGAGLMAVVKADAYGHGMVPVARAALSAGATRLAVAGIREGVALREAGITAPIQLLTSSLPEELNEGIAADLTFAVSSIDEIKALADRSRALNQGTRRGIRTKAHLMFDTGMGRGGFCPDEVWPAVEHVKAEKTLDLDGIFTHFSSAEEPDPEPTQQQIQIFRGLLRDFDAQGLSFRVTHAANSAGTVFHRDAHFSFVRCGVLLHGMRAWAAERDGLELLPALSLYTRILHIGRRAPGWTVGYNRTYVCQKESFIATLPVGYAEGYRRALTGRGNVIIRGQLLPVIGTVSMNAITVDLTPLAHSAAGLPEVGEIVTLIGGGIENRITVEELAEKSGTIPYVVTAQLGHAVERRHLHAEPEPRAEREFEMRAVEPANVTPLPPAESQTTQDEPARQVAGA